MNLCYLHIRSNFFVPLYIQGINIIIYVQGILYAYKFDFEGNLILSFKQLKLYIIVHHFKCNSYVPIKI